MSVKKKRRSCDKVHYLSVQMTPRYYKSTVVVLFHRWLDRGRLIYYIRGSNKAEIDKQFPLGSFDNDSDTHGHRSRVWTMDRIWLEWFCTLSHSNPRHSQVSVMQRFCLTDNEGSRSYITLRGALTSSGHVEPSHMLWCERGKKNRWYIENRRKRGGGGAAVAAAKVS